MGLRQWLLRPKREQDLLRTLIDRVVQRDYSAVVGLIDERADDVRQQFAGWLQVPEPLRTDRAALERYTQTLVLVAQVFAEAGDESLVHLLSGGRRNNPAERWRAELLRAQTLLDAQQCAEAAAVARSVLQDMEGASGSAVDAYRAKALGQLGLALARVGHAEDASAAWREALQICRDTGDEEGAAIYAVNLAQLESSAAASDESASTVAFFDEHGRQLREDELGEAAGTIRWEVRGPAPLHPDAHRLHLEGRAAGARGDYAEAIELLTRAAALDASWPYPVYDRAFSRLLQQDFDGALADYRATLLLAPRGFFTAAQAVNLLSREADGEFPRGLYAAFVALDGMSQAEQRNVLSQLVEKFPSHAPAWERYVDFLSDPAERLDAIQAGLASAPDPDTRGSLLVKMALAESALGRVDRAIEILQPLLTQEESLSTSASARLVLARLRAKRLL